MINLHTILQLKKKRKLNSLLFDNLYLSIRKLGMEKASICNLSSLSYVILLVILYVCVSWLYHFVQFFQNKHLSQPDASRLRFRCELLTDEDSVTVKNIAKTNTK